MLSFDLLVIAPEYSQGYTFTLDKSKPGYLIVLSEIEVTQLKYFRSKNLLDRDERRTEEQQP